ncbi:cyclic-phosphate processing receiver domain-containing protein [Loktanella sp. DJP18]|uniref:cyclic-phosphate processing receiver domain-containing protein n=1 Tax=Loktanella sp. DJP18 TaxID=3409788 RepID=UPI003BB6ADCA
MNYALFIDDERFPAKDRDAVGRPWIISRSLDEVRDAIAELGAPAYASFDLDLGDQVPSGLDIAKAMVNADMIARYGKVGDETDALACGFDEVGFRFPEGFSFTVHSMNSVGGPNIQAYLARYLGLMDRD